MTPEELESHTSELLAPLPDPRAPESLLPSVLARVGEPAEQPLIARPWIQWPRLVQATSIAALVALALLAGPTLERAASSEVTALADAITLVWKVFVEPNAAFLAASVGVMSVASAAFCAALARIL